jgi:hypothetical protein
MAAGDATPNTTPTTMALPPPPPARYSADAVPSRPPGEPPPGTPIDLGPPLAAWHAADAGADAGVVERTPRVTSATAGPGAGQPGAPPQAPPSITDARPPAPPPQEPPPAPPKMPAAGPLAGKGKLAGGGGKSVRFLGGPAADRPLRGPAVAILHWLYRHSRGGGRQLAPGGKTPASTSKLGQQVGRAPGLPTQPPGGAATSY